MPDNLLPEAETVQTEYEPDYSWMDTYHVPDDAENASKGIISAVCIGGALGGVLLWWWFG